MSDSLKGKSVELEIEIETHDDRLGFSLFESPDRVSDGQTKAICDEVFIRAKGGRIFEAIDFPSILYASVYVGEHVLLPVAAGLLSRYLYDKLKERKDNKLRINGTQVDVNAEKIEQLIIVLLNRAKEKEEKG